MRLACCAARFRGNAVFSAVSGIVLIAGAAPLGTLLGVGAPAVLPAVGVVLVLYAGGLWWNARRPKVDRAEASIAVALDVAWIVLSAALLIFAPSLLMPAGRWLVAAVAVCVAGFAIVQALGLRALDRR